MSKVIRQAGPRSFGGTALFNNTVRLTSAGSVSALPGYEAGEWWVQDVSAALPAVIAGDVSGRHVLDLCAAPGGKTLQLASAGAKVTAIDKSELRMKRIDENLKRTGLQADLHTSDALNWGDPKPEFDIVLLDAPCSATGTFRRHPDVIHSKSPKSISTLIKLQGALLRRAAKWVRPGGSLIYCTCSLQTEEGENQIDKFLKYNEQFAIAPVTRLDGLPLPERAYEGGYLRVLPHDLSSVGGMDGFFTAKLDCLS